MNGKRAKQLRKLAEENTVGNEDVYYEGFKKNGTPLVRLQPGCTRHEEKQLKRIYKDSHIKGNTQC